MNTEETPNKLIVPPEVIGKLQREIDATTFWIRFDDLIFVAGIESRVYTTKDPEGKIIACSRYDRAMNRSELRRINAIAKRLILRKKNPDPRRYTKLINPSRRIVLGY